GDGPTGLFRLGGSGDLRGCHQLQCHGSIGASVPPLRLALFDGDPSVLGKPSLSPFGGVGVNAALWLEAKSALTVTVAAPTRTAATTVADRRADAHEQAYVVLALNGVDTVSVDSTGGRNTSGRGGC